MWGVMSRPEVLSLFARQYWVASVWQLRQLGVSKDAIRHACGVELILRIVPGVYQVPSARLGIEGRCMVLQLLAPNGSFISGPTAGRLYGLRRMPSSPVEITVPHHVRRVVPPWARLVTCSSIVAGRDVVWRDDGIAVASPARTLFRLAVVFNQFRFERAAEDMWHKGLVSPTDTSYLADVRRSGRAESQADGAMAGAYGGHATAERKRTRAGPDPARHPRRSSGAGEASTSVAQRRSHSHRHGMAGRPLRPGAGTHVVARR